MCTPMHASWISVCPGLHMTGPGQDLHITADCWLQSQLPAPEVLVGAWSGCHQAQRLKIILEELMGSGLRSLFGTAFRFEEQQRDSPASRLCTGQAYQLRQSGNCKKRLGGTAFQCWQEAFG